MLTVATEKYRHLSYLNRKPCTIHIWDTNVRAKI